MKRATLLVAIAAMVASGAAGAASVVGSAANITGLTGLVVDGITYNVAFSTTTYDATFPGSSSPTFLGNPAGAEAAALALQTAFNAAGVTGTSGQACVSVVPCGVGIPFQLGCGSNAECLSKGASDAFLMDFITVVPPDVTWTAASGFGYGAQPLGLVVSSGTMRFRELAVFSPGSPAVPEPGTLVLLGLGLVGLYVSRRRFV
jgi:hypothetical protein